MSGLKSLIALSVAISFWSTATRADDRPCEPITVFAAASTTDALNAIADAYEQDTACSVSLVFASSGTLAKQIAAGAPADLFLSASDEWTRWLVNAGHVKRQNQIDLLGNDLVLIAPSNTRTQASADTRDTILSLVGDARLALGDPNSVPAGKYASIALRSLGLQTLFDTQTVHAASVRDALTWVARGETPAGIVYRTDAAIEPRVTIVTEIALPAGSEITYPLALIGRSPHAAAIAFYTHLQEYEAASHFADHGFRRKAVE